MSVQIPMNMVFPTKLSPQKLYQCIFFKTRQPRASPRMSSQRPKAPMLFVHIQKRCFTVQRTFPTGHRSQELIPFLLLLSECFCFSKSVSADACGGAGSVTGIHYTFPLKRRYFEQHISK